MRRREFIAVVGGAAATWPLASRAQQPAMPVVGFLHSGSVVALPHVKTAFERGLSEAGYTNGRNVTIEYHWADGQYERLPLLAADLIHRQVAVILGGSPPAVLAVKAATDAIPIVFVVGSDPVRSGLVSSLNHPGGNITGVSIFTGQLGSKALALLRELVPSASVVGMLVNPANPLSESMTSDVQAAAATAGQRVYVVKAGTKLEIRKAFVTLSEMHADGLVVAGDPFFGDRATQIVLHAALSALPVIYMTRDMVKAGGLMSYGADLTNSYRQAGNYVGRILKGTKPGELPVLQPTTFELVINLQAAEVLGLTVPPTLLAIADEVIE
jgi:putative ABC transport system substrate-binding protein